MATNDFTGTSGYGTDQTGAVSNRCCAGPVAVTLTLTVRPLSQLPQCPQSGSSSGFAFAPGPDGLIGAVAPLRGPARKVTVTPQVVPPRVRDGKWAVPLPAPLVLPDAARPGGRAVVSLAAGPTGREWLAVAGPSHVAAARRWGAAYRVIPGPHNDPFPMRLKWGLSNLLRWYDRVVFLDADVLVAPDCPDLFALVPAGAVGVRDDWPHLTKTAWVVEEMAAVRAAAGLPPRPAVTCYNTGVLVLDAAHAGLVAAPPAELPSHHCAEQHWFNVRVEEEAPAVFPLPPELHWLPLMGEAARARAKVRHLAGQVDRTRKLAEAAAEMGLADLPPLPGCAFRGPLIPRAAGRERNLPATADWYPCQRPGFERAGTAVTTCTRCGLSDAQRCRPGFCPGYEAGEDD
jgi:hypothetical protein